MTSAVSADNHKTVVKALEWTCQRIQEKVDNLEKLDHDTKLWERCIKSTSKYFPPFSEETYNKKVQEKAELVAFLPLEIDAARALKQIIDEAPPIKGCKCGIHFAERHYGPFMYPWVYVRYNDN